ncbi:probable serine/threonine-protein phosphatase 2A regulatory subunit B'' subunit TON2, partial [Tanacetum coccineum]
KPEDSSISHKVQRLANYRFLKKQADLLLNADDLDAMSIDVHFVTLLSSHSRTVVSALYLLSTEDVSLTQARIDMSELDEDSDGFLQHHEMEAYIRGLIPNLAQLRDLPTMFVQMYCCIASQKFFFFCDPIRRGKACIKKVLLSNCSGTHGTTSDVFLALDKDMNGSLSKQELREYTDGTLTDIFIERAFDEHLRRDKSGNANAREMDFESFLDFVLALARIREPKDSPEGFYNSYLLQMSNL